MLIFIIKCVKIFIEERGINMKYSDIKSLELPQMLNAVKAVHDLGYTPIGIANEIGVAPMDLNEWLEKFDDVYHFLYDEDY